MAFHPSSVRIALPFLAACSLAACALGSTTDGSSTFTGASSGTTFGTDASTSSEPAATEDAAATPSCATTACGEHATCAEGASGPACSCETGYEGDGGACASIDPCAADAGGCDPNATCTHTGPGTSSCACNDGYVGDGTTCAAPVTVSSYFPTNGYDLSGSGGYMILLSFAQDVTLTGNGSATLYDVTAGTSIAIAANTVSLLGTKNVRLYIDNGATHHPAHTYAMKISADLIQGYAGIDDTTTYTWLR